MVLANESLDLDYLCLTEKCSTMFAHSPVQSFFADLPCELLSKGFIQNLYSKRNKKIFCIAKVGDYSLGLVVQSSDSNLEDEAEDLSIATGFQLSFESDRYLCASIVNQFLGNQCRLLTKVISFESLGGILSTEYATCTVAIARYGQKVPLSVIKPKLVDFLSGCAIPIEVALGQEFEVNGYFLSAKYSGKVKQFAYSNFLSNDLCNILINNEIVARAHCPTCFRLSVYSTLQHHKKDVKIFLERSGAAVDCSLSNFGCSLERSMARLSALCEKIPLAKLRVEMYFSVSSLPDLNNSIRCLRLALQSFELVKCPVDQVQLHFMRSVKLTMQLYSHCKAFEDSKSLCFILFYSKLSSYVFSTEKMSGNFITDNLGLFLSESSFEDSSFVLLPAFTKQYTVHSVYNALVAVFGTSAKSTVFVSYYLAILYIQFKSCFNGEQSVVRFMAQKIGAAIVDLCSVSDSQLHLPVVESNIYVILQAIATRFTKKVFVVELVQCFLKSSIESDELFAFLQSYLLSVEFKFCFSNSLYSLKNSTEYVCTLSYDLLSEVVSRYTSDEFINLLRKGHLERSSSEKRDLQYFEEFLRMFEESELRLADFFLGLNGDFVPLNKRIHMEREVLASFLFVSVPLGRNITIHSEMVNAISLFTSFESLIKFIYATALKYYHSDSVGHSRYKKYTTNLFPLKRMNSVKDASKNFDGLTFNKVIYFSGRFDRTIGREGIYLPLLDKMYLLSRYGKVPHQQYTCVHDILRGRSANSDVREATEKLNQIQYVFENQMSSNENSLLFNVNGDLNQNFDTSDDSSLDLTSPFREKNFDTSFDVNAELPLSFPEVPVTSVVPVVSVQVPISEATSVVLSSAVPFKRVLEEVLPLPSQSQFVSALISNDVTEDLLSESSVTDLTDYFVDMCGFSRITAVTVAKKLKVRFS